MSDEQRERGLRAPSATDVFYDLNASVGGPVLRDRLWFSGSARRFRVDRFEASTFNPDGSQALDENFIWNAPGKLIDGLPVRHTAAYDAVYVDALDIDYAALGRAQQEAIALLRSGEVRVTSPAGTVSVGDRPFNRQDGDASRARMASARVRVDREIELPAGVLRVAPVESSANGTIAIPSARFGDAVVRQARLTIVDGVVTPATAAEGLDALEAFLKSAPAASRFREFGLGFNPKLVVPAGHTALPCYGYGDAVVRLSLGDNEEVGGAVRGGGVRWLFFPDTTVTVGATTLVRDGKLVRAPAGTR